MALRITGSLLCLFLFIGLARCQRVAPDPMDGLDYGELAHECAAHTPGASASVTGGNQWSSTARSLQGDHYETRIDTRVSFVSDAVNAPEVLKCTARAVAREIGRRRTLLDQVEIGTAEAAIAFHRGPRHGQVQLLCFEEAGVPGPMETPPHFVLALMVDQR